MLVEKFFESLSIHHATSSCHDTSGFRKTSDARFSTGAREERSRIRLKWQISILCKQLIFSDTPRVAGYPDDAVVPD